MRPLKAISNSEQPSGSYYLRIWPTNRDFKVGKAGLDSFNFVLDITGNYLVSFLRDEGAAQMLVSKLLR